MSNTPKFIDIYNHNILFMYKIELFATNNIKYKYKYKYYLFDISVLIKRLIHIN